MNRHFEKYIRLFSHTWLSLTMACLVFSFFVTGCGSDDDDTPPNDPSIIGEIQSKPSLSTLFTALEKYPDLTSTLTSPGTFTVFAPTNQAFDDFLTKIGQTDVNEISEDVLKNVLQYHMVVTATLSTGQLVNGNLKSANNEDIAVAVSADVKLNGVVNIVMPNIEATNGVVHIIDAVLIPPSVLPVFSTIVAIPYFDRDFTTLMAAINAADPTILTTLLGNGPSGKKLTIFAPTNDAFVAAGITTLPDQASLNAMLKYHVIDDEILTDELPTGSTTIPTLDGNLYVSNQESAGIFINGPSEILVMDITASNGVVHTISNALLPPTKIVAQVISDMSTSTTPELAQLYLALTRTSGTATDLLAALTNEASNLTIFTPTDAAFQQLYTTLGVNGVNDIPLATLTGILQHHIVASRVFSNDFINGEIATLNGDVTVNPAKGTLTDGKGNVANLSTNGDLLDILGTNGVVHMIDRVLRP